MRPGRQELSFCTFKELSDRWNISEDRIEQYIQLGKFKFEPQFLDIDTPIDERDRIARLLPILNHYASERIDELILDNRLKSKLVKERWTTYRMSDKAFEAWLSYYGGSIKSTRIVIPLSEAIRFDEELLSKEKPASEKNLPIIVIVQQVARKLYEKNRKWPNYRDVLSSLKQVANEDGITGGVIASAGKDGICLKSEDTFEVKTVQNWLSKYKKTFPELQRKAPHKVIPRE